MRTKKKGLRRGEEGRGRSGEARFSWQKGSLQKKVCSNVGIGIEERHETDDEG